LMCSVRVCVWTSRPMVVGRKTNADLLRHLRGVRLYMPRCRPTAAKSRSPRVLHCVSRELLSVPRKRDRGIQRLHTHSNVQSHI
jgi:hypothetical protein